jgi:hypothetical protein
VSSIEKLFEFQNNRLSRGESYGSGSDISSDDDFANYSIEKRVAIQFLNNVITPLRFLPPTVPKALALLDSFLYLSVWMSLLRKIGKNSIMPTHDFSARVSNVFFVWSITALFAFSLIISNGGNAFRYKSFWALPLTISFYLQSRSCSSTPFLSSDASHNLT